MSKLQRAAEVHNEDPDEAYELIQQELYDEPDSAAANTLAGVLMMRAERYGAALAYFHRACMLRPDKVECWNNLGACYQDMRFPARAREFWKRALEIEDNARTCAQMAVTYADENDFGAAWKWLKRAEKHDPKETTVAKTRAYVAIATGDWKQGWKDWAQTIGSKFRPVWDYGVPMWDGKPTKTLLVYGEQGLGDEIQYASCIADCRGLAESIVIECDPKLGGLYKRSFPWATVHPTRREDKFWLEGAGLTAQIPVGNLPALFRESPDACPRVPYLTPDPERVLMWKALFDSYGKPVIGLAWTGGKRRSTQVGKRAVGLESFRPLIESRDAVFVSLQYTDPRAEIEATGLPVRFFSETLSPNYDDTAALVYALDDVIGVHTTVHHVRGAMGKGSTVLVPHEPMWQYVHGDRIAWYPASVYHRQRKSEAWTDCIKRLC
jgi:Tfp pilus assembly protein PilF